MNTQIPSVLSKIGHLKLLERVQKPFKNTHRNFWRCECDCGKIIDRREDYLLSGRSIIISCGCKHPAKLRTSDKHENWLGRHELSGQYFSSIRCRAKKLNIEFAITIDFCWKLFVTQNKKCALTNIDIVLEPSYRTNMSTLNQTASLDRIDSSKGYIEGNVQWIHKDVNRMKNSFTQDRFIEICKLVTYNSGK